MIPFWVLLPYIKYTIDLMPQNLVNNLRIPTVVRRRCMVGAGPAGLIPNTMMNSRLGAFKQVQRSGLKDGVWINNYFNGFILGVLGVS